MRRRRELAASIGLALVLGAGVAAEPPSLLGSFDLGNRKEPITVTADTLEYDYKTNVVVYRGAVEAAQGPVKLRSDSLTVTLQPRSGDQQNPKPIEDTSDAARVQQIVAVGSVRIDNGTRWATGGRAVFDQATRTLVLTETPVLHDGSNEVAGDRVVVYLDQDRSVVEGGRRRVKAVLYPDQEGGGTQARGSSGP